MNETPQSDTLCFHGKRDFFCVISKILWNDIRYMYLLDGMKAPSFATLASSERNSLIQWNRFLDVNTYIFQRPRWSGTYLYRWHENRGASRTCYTWVWKNPVQRIAERFWKIRCFSTLWTGSVWIFKSETWSGKSMPSIMFQNFWKCTEKVPDWMSPHLFPVVVIGKSIYQKQYQELQGYLKRLKPMLTI